MIGARLAQPQSVSATNVSVIFFFIWHANSVLHSAGQADKVRNVIEEQLPLGDAQNFVCPFCEAVLLHWPVDSGWSEHCDPRPARLGFALAEKMAARGEGHD